MEEVIQLFHLINTEIRLWIRVFTANDAIQVQSCKNKLSYFSTLLGRLLPVVNERAPVLLPVLNDLKELTDLVLSVEGISESNSEEIHVAQSNLPTVIHSSNGGRPAYSIPLEQLTALRHSGMSWSGIANFYGISKATIYRKKWQVPELPSLSDASLRSELISLKHENRDCGEVYALGHLRAAGYYVTRERVREQLRGLDPVGTMHRRRIKTKRRIYNVSGPNVVWHMDGNEKLQPYGIYIHGAIDGFSRKIMYLFCATNKKATTVLNGFGAAVGTFGYPRKVRGDYGRENIEVARHMLERFGISGGKFITGKSVHNIRIERLWSEVNKVTFRYRYIFRHLQSEGYYDFTSALDRFCLYYVFLPRIQGTLKSFTSMWDCHKIRTAERQSPNQMYLTGVHPPISQVILNNVFEELSREEDESLNPEFFRTAVEVLPDPCEDDQNDGVALYLLLKQVLTLPSRG